MSLALMAEGEVAENISKKAVAYVKSCGNQRGG